jgi:transposase
MPAPLPIRADRDPAELRRLARLERDGKVSARLLALANALEGIPREGAARLAGMTGQTLGDGVHRYNGEGVAGLGGRPRSGRAPRLDGSRQATLEAWILRGPRLERDGCAAWRIRDLCALVERRFGVVHSESGMLPAPGQGPGPAPAEGPAWTCPGRRPGLDLSRQKARPVHPGADPKARERFKKPAQRDAGGRRPPSRGRAGRALVRG